MPDRYQITLRTALASNTGGPYTATWDQAVVAEPGTIRSVEAAATSVTSNVRQSSVDIFLQSSGPAAGSNTATTILVSPITLVNDLTSVAGTVRHGNPRVATGDILQLRTDSGNAGSKPAFLNLSAAVIVERD